jgi:hypothetical protein
MKKIIMITVIGFAISANAQNVRTNVPNVRKPYSQQQNVSGETPILNFKLCNGQNDYFHFHSNGRFEHCYLFEGKWVRLGGNYSLTNRENGSYWYHYTVKLKWDNFNVPEGIIEWSKSQVQTYEEICFVLKGYNTVYCNNNCK